VSQQPAYPVFCMKDKKYRIPYEILCQMYNWVEEISILSTWSSGKQ